MGFRAPRGNRECRGGSRPRGAQFSRRQSSYLSRRRARRRSISAAKADGPCCRTRRYAPAGLPTTTERFNSGFAAGARIGYEEGSWRFEAEYAYRRNEADSITSGGANFNNIGGSRQANAFLANLIYEIDFGWPVKPHIGAGIGGVYLKDKLNGPGLPILNDNNWEIGYQGIGGLRYDLTPEHRGRSRLPVFRDDRRDGST